ncbi:ABC transporter substrate-binding protein [Rhodococcoides kyotonense]|uniref:Iron complex transport system substrate-binding protein n=1 Tax=Rhodococcoides kyotonense TaxID=398843 RepID=A0A239H2J0_9NOCA|nr:ABC transporter substrate-binding protein [Rhodococcus kyotonensis]SNS75600.1 iron complex transport system substrate-binding protein [Rhodococcus kyotonensis]
MTTINASRRRLVATAALVGGLAAATLTACGQEVAAGQTEAQVGFPVEVSDCGRQIAVAGSPQRVVAMSPSQTEAIIRLGLTDRLVGQAQTASHELPEDIRGEAAGVPVLAADSPPSREVLLAANPDFVFAPSSFEFSAESGFASIDQVTAAGATAYIAAGGCSDRRAEGSVDDIFTDIDTLGTIFDVPDAARAVADDARARLDAVARDVEGKPTPTVAQLYVEATSISAIAGGVEADVVRQAGGESVYNGEEPIFAQSPWATVSSEDIVARQPEAIVFAVTSEENEKEVRAILQERLGQTPAVREGNLIAVPAPDLSPGAFGNITAVETVARQLHR